MICLLLTGAYTYTPAQLQMLADLGSKPIFMQQEAAPLPLPAADVDAIVCNGLFLHQPLDQFSRLAYIQLTSAGLDRVPVEAISQRGIRLHNARGVYSIPMAEWATMRVLEHYKHAAAFRNEQSACRWTKDRTLREVAGARVGIVGAGNVGQEVARRLGAFGAIITGFDPYFTPQPYFDAVVDISHFSSHLPELDIIVLTAPLTHGTYHLMSHDMLGKLRPGAMLVNIARGGLVDEAALVEILRQRPDLHAALDVFEHEPLPPESPLWSLPNVALSPHNSFVGTGNRQRMFSVIYDNLKKYIQSL